jgi:hypothetical protein
MKTAEMNEILHVFEPNTRELSIYLIGGVALFVICTVLFVVALRKNKKLLLLFSGFIGITAVGTALFSGLTQNRMDTVTLYQNGMHMPDRQLTFDEIRMIKLEEVRQNSKFPIHREGRPIMVDSTSLLLVEEYGGRVHVLSRENYPIDSIFKELSVLVNDWREKHPPK